MPIPCKKCGIDVRLGNLIVNKIKKEFKDRTSSKTKRLRLKNSDASPLAVPLMMIHITQECVNRPNMKWKLSTKMLMIGCCAGAVRLDDASGVVKFTIERFTNSMPIKKHVIVKLHCDYKIK